MNTPLTRRTDGNGASAEAVPGGPSAAGAADGYPLPATFVHHLPYPGLLVGRAGMKAVGQFVTSALKDIQVTVTLAVGEGDLVADRIEAAGVRLDSAERIAWVENHFYRVENGRITELWPAGGPDLP